MEAIKEQIKPDRLKVRQSLVLATLDSIKAGIRLDDLEKQVIQQAAEGKAKRKVRERKRRIALLKDDEKDKSKSGSKSSTQSQRRTYRAFEDRRFALMLASDQHHLLAKDKAERTLFPDAPPLDYSFCFLNTIEEIVSEGEPPQERRGPTQPIKTFDERYITSSLRLSYNVIRNMEGFINTMYKILENGPHGLCWLDLSFNSVDAIDEETLTQLPNLCILYLHGNQIEDMFEVRKLKALPSLHTLTLHGNPIEQDDSYRVCVLYYMPYLKHLDFIAVTKGDRAKTAQFGRICQSRWTRKHAELVELADELRTTENMSLTERYMQGADTEYYHEPAT